MLGDCCPGAGIACALVNSYRTGSLETLANITGFSPSRKGNSSQDHQGRWRAAQDGRSWHSTVRMALCYFGVWEWNPLLYLPHRFSPRVMSIFGYFIYVRSHAIQLRWTEQREACCALECVLCIGPHAFACIPVSHLITSIITLWGGITISIFSIKSLRGYVIFTKLYN